MITRDFHDKKLPLLGFGCMRLPIKEGGTPADIDEDALRQMIRYAMENGVNYFDTAHPYHGGKSESVLGKLLAEYPRESYFLADKFPGHQIMSDYRPAEIFEEQLEKCGTDYFDFYLLHNVFENSYKTFTDPKYGIIDYLIEQKKNGRIRHLGFSTHGGLPIMTEFLDKYGEHMEFCQIQLNYLDWTLQNAAAKVELLNSRNIPIWVMEPVRGGKLVNLHTEDCQRLSAFRPDHSPAAWAFRFLQNIPGVTMILSGMSNFEQLRENIETFREEKKVNEKERELLFEIAEHLKSSVPCTACSYCVKDCPKELDIPFLLSIYNELKVVRTFNSSMRIEFLPEEKKPSACISCGKCSRTCPQKIDIPKTMKELTQILTEIPSWAKISREREEIANRERKNKNQ